MTAAKGSINFLLSQAGTKTRECDKVRAPDLVGGSAQNRLPCRLFSNG